MSNTFESVNPATGETIDSYPWHHPSEAEAALGRAQIAQAQWRRTPLEERCEVFSTAAELLLEEKEELACSAALEMGKPLREGRAEVEKCAAVCDYYARASASFLALEGYEIDGKRAYVTFEPLGSILGVMPWNFPFWQVFRFAAPTLLAGNGVMIKPAANVPACALATEKLLCRAGLPEHLFANLFLPEEEVAQLIAHPAIQGVSLTGSAAAGSEVAAIAAGLLKPTVLELGGSDPYLILPDADVSLAAEKCIASRLINCGQSCIAAKRFIVCRQVRDEFEEKLVELAREKTFGDPLDETSDIGPLAREDLRAHLHRQVEASVEAEATLLLGGWLPNTPGWFYPPTVLTDVAPDSPAGTEELFGPVAAILPVENIEEAIRVANDSRYGLGAAIFSRNEKLAERIAAERLEVGACFINDFVRSDPRLPFGGVKDSGYGRELGHHGIREFVNAKTVLIG